MDRELTRYQYEIPDERWRRIQWALSLAERPFLYALLAVFMFGGVWAAAHPPYHLGYYITFATCLAALAIFAWAIYWAWQRPVYTDRTLGVTINYDPAYYFPPHLFRSLARTVVWNYTHADGGLDGLKASKVYRGATVDVMKDPPNFPGNDPSEFALEQRDLPEDEEPRELTDGDTVVGLYYPKAHYIAIYGPYALKMGGLGYELSHVIDERLWPGQSEGKDLEKGRELGIRPLRWPPKGVA